MKNTDTYVRCDVVVHGNGLFAKVRAFDPNGLFLPLVSIRPGDFISAEIVTVFAEPVTIRRNASVWLDLGEVLWIDDGTITVRIIRMSEEDQCTLDNSAWLCVKGETRLFHWFRTFFLGNVVRDVHISYSQISHHEEACVAQAA